MTLEEAIDAYKGEKVKIGSKANFLYFGECNDALKKYMEVVDPCSLSFAITGIFNSELDEGWVIILYESERYGRFWFEWEFLKSMEHDIYEALKNGTYDPKNFENRKAFFKYNLKKEVIN